MTNTVSKHLTDELNTAIKNAQDAMQAFIDDSKPNTRDVSDNANEQLFWLLDKLAKMQSVELQVVIKSDGNIG